MQHATGLKAYGYFIKLRKQWYIFQTESLESSRLYLRGMKKRTTWFGLESVSEEGNRNFILKELVSKKFKVDFFTLKRFHYYLSLLVLQIILVYFLHVYMWEIVLAVYPSVIYPLYRHSIFVGSHFPCLWNELRGTMTPHSGNKI